jgi:hypothetical protein
MWLAVILPALVVPVTVRRPPPCPACGATPRIHDHRAKKLPLLSEANSYNTSRFRCPTCKQVTSADHYRPMGQSGVDQEIEAWIAFQYVLGVSVPEIVTNLVWNRVTLKRASVYRVIKLIADDQMRALHQANRRPALSIPHISGGAIDLQDEEVLARIAHMVPEILEQPHDTPALLALRWIILRRTAFVVRTYDDITGRTTCDWLEQYLHPIRDAGLFTYSSARELAKDFGLGAYPQLISFSRIMSFSSFIRIGDPPNDVSQQDLMVRMAVRQALGYASRNKMVLD